MLSICLLNWQEELELWRQFLLGVQLVREVDTSNAAVGMDLDSQCLDVVGSVGSSSKVRKVELDLVPAVIKPHWHRANERLHSCSRLVVTGSETPSYVLVIEHLNFKAEVLLQVLYQHDQEGQLDSQSPLRVSWTGHKGSANICAHDFEYT